jgi:hypothetical protein
MIGIDHVLEGMFQKIGEACKGRVFLPAEEIAI